MDEYEFMSIMRESFNQALFSVEEEAAGKGLHLDQCDTTLTLAVLAGGDLYYGHAGDSGMFAYYSDGILAPVTTPQNDEEERVFPLCCGETMWVFEKLQKKVASVLLCTDGIWSMFFPHHLRRKSERHYIALLDYYLDPARIERRAENSGVKSLSLWLEEDLKSLDPMVFKEDDATLLIMADTSVAVLRQAEGYYRMPALDEMEITEEDEPKSFDAADKSGDHSLELVSELPQESAKLGKTPPGEAKAPSKKKKAKRMPSSGKNQRVQPKESSKKNLNARRSQPPREKPRNQSSGGLFGAVTRLISGEANASSSRMTLSDALEYDPGYALSIEDRITLAQILCAKSGKPSSSSERFSPKKAFVASAPHDIAMECESSTPSGFHLAFYIYPLLMNGIFPFDCKDPDIPLIDASRKYIFDDSTSTLLHELKYVLPGRLISMFHLAFTEGKSDPDAIPGASEWSQALDDYKRSLLQCASNLKHHHVKLLRRCPWCVMDNVFLKKAKQGKNKRL
jgi:hypothetical protein